MSSVCVDYKHAFDDTLAA